MPKTRPPYAPEFRQQMVDLVRAGRDPEDLARKFEPSAQAIRNWVADADRRDGRRVPKPAAADAALTLTERDELARLRRENKQLRLERDILFSSSGLVRAGDRGRTPGLFAFMRANQAAFPVTIMARVLGVSKAGLARVQDVHVASRDTYGAPRVHAALRAQGERHGRKRIARLMRLGGLVGACYRTGGPTTTRRDQEARPAPDLVDRNFKAQAPDQLWVADITDVPTMSGFLYLAVVLDVFIRRIVGWSMQKHLRTELIVNALDIAVGQRRPKDVIHHSDQGCQYTSLAFGSRCREAGVRPSMGSVGDAYDNAMAESFFSTLECELLGRRSFSSQAEARMACFTYIEAFYNPLRLHSRLGYRSPIDYERCYHDDQAAALIPQPAQVR
ncbi:MAG: IS3 family transposase [Janthinobacterium lividum]